MKTTLTLILLGGLFAGAAQAQPRQTDFERCAAVQNEAARLACYDALMAEAKKTPTDQAPPVAAAPQPTLSQSDGAAPAIQQPSVPQVESDDYVVLPRAEAEALRRQAGEKVREEKRDAYESRIVKVFTTGYGIMNVVLENGETWRQLTKTGGRKPRVGDIATLTPAMMGSWTVRYGDSGAKVKVKRIAARQ